jgi:fructosamine-3-kinase
MLAAVGAGHKALRQQEFMVQGVLAEAETLEVVAEAQEVSIPEAVVAEVDITLLQAVQADQVS